MITMVQANSISNSVRDHFEWGYKSDNKVYSLDYGNASDVKKRRRNRNSLEASTIIRMQRAEDFTISDKMDVLFSERAGNCEEYTELAVHFALDKDPVSNIWTFGCDNSAGVSHIFCVFNLPQAPNNLPCLKTMSSENSYSDVIACDPWANIVCLYANYPRRLREKMIKWHARGKCITLGRGSIPAIEWGRRCLNAPADFEQKR